MADGQPPSRREAALPNGLTPRYLSREEVAAYVGVSPRTFDEEMQSGQWPQPRKRGAKGARVTWDRVLIDAFADRDSGLGGILSRPRLESDDTTIQPGRDVDSQVLAAAEDAALRGLAHAAPKHRSQHRQPKAA